MECMVNYYIENIMKDNIVITTNKKLLLPHLSSFLHLIETRANDEFKKVYSIMIIINMQFLYSDIFMCTMKYIVTMKLIMYTAHPIM